MNRKGVSNTLDIFLQFCDLQSKLKRRQYCRCKCHENDICRQKQKETEYCCKPTNTSSQQRYPPVKLVMCLCPDKKLARSSSLQTRHCSPKRGHGIFSSTSISKSYTNSRKRRGRSYSDTRLRSKSNERSIISRSFVRSTRNKKRKRSSSLSKTKRSVSWAKKPSIKSFEPSSMETDTSALKRHPSDFSKLRTYVLKKEMGNTAKDTDNGGFLNNSSGHTHSTTPVHVDKTNYMEGLYNKCMIQSRQREATYKQFLIKQKVHKESEAIKAKVCGKDLFQEIMKSKCNNPLNVYIPKEGGQMLQTTIEMGQPKLKLENTGLDSSPNDSSDEKSKSDEPRKSRVASKGEGALSTSTVHSRKSRNESKFATSEQESNPQGNKSRAFEKSLESAGALTPKASNEGVKEIEDEVVVQPS